MPALNEIYRRYREHAAFLVVYIQEAHATDGWQTAANIRDKVLVPNARDANDRTQAAASCVRNLGIELPALIDDMGNTAEAAYAGWPDRLYVVDRDGLIAYKSEPGPFGFKPDEMEAALRRLLGAPAMSLPATGPGY